MDSLYFSVTIPICSFRKGSAREYLETEEVPPPSTVYGFLLSLVGEEDREKYVGSQIAYAIVQEPEMSLILRTTWRVKKKIIPMGIGENSRPDYQQILTNLELVIWVKPGDLSRKLEMLRVSPEKISRFGGVSLGESRDLINDIYWCPDWSQKEGLWLSPSSEGDMTLPIWVDHVGSKNTVWNQFVFSKDKLETPNPSSPQWITIHP